MMWKSAPSPNAPQRYKGKGKMSKKDRYKFADEIETLPEAAAVKPPCESGDIQSQEGIENETQPEVKKNKPNADFYWDLADTRYNILDRVFTDGEVMAGVKTDSSGAPKDPALKAAYEKKYLKAKE
jgi:hypothetical protein